MRKKYQNAIFFAKKVSFLSKNNKKEYEYQCHKV